MSQPNDGDDGQRRGPMTLDGQPADSSLPEGWGQPQRRTGGIGNWSGGSQQRAGGGIATLFNTGIAGSAPPPPPSGDDDDDEAGGPQDFFAGGHRSGLAVTNPDQRGGNGPDGIVKNILQQARQNGPTHMPEPATSSAWGSSGNRLGSEDDPEPEAAPVVPHFDAPENDAEGDEDDESPQIRRLTFWRNGFSIQDGPLLSYEDPENKQLLEAIQAGRAPRSVFDVAFNQPLQVEVAKRLNEDYQPPPKQPMKAFEGSGNRLGSAAPAVVSGTSTPTMPGSFASGAASSSAPPAPASAPSFSVDNNKPTTSIQVRLADGTRMVAKVNLTHTVADLRGFVAAARPDSRPFVLQTTFPSKELSDPAQTIEEAKLQNAVVVQRFT